MRGSSLSGYAGPLVVLTLAALCGLYIRQNLAEFAFVWSLSGPPLIMGGGLLLAAYLVSAWQLGLFLAHFGVRPGRLELTVLTMGIALGNLVTPMRGGTGAAALYLRRVHGLDYASFAVIYAGTGLLTALINSGFALLGTVFLAASTGVFLPALTTLSALLFLGCLALCVFPPSFMNSKGQWVKKIAEAAASWRALTRELPLLLKISLTFVLVSVCLAGTFYFIYEALDAKVTPFGALIISSLGNIANLAAITPGALGIFDATVIQAPRELGLDTPKAVTAALIFRAFSFLWPALLGLPGIIYFGGRKTLHGPD
jgi:uncharacterized membrane protein YbhN (UPF0104 family)